MQVNVATLLQEQIGSTRDFEFEPETVSVPAFDYTRVVEGHVRLVRTERGVLVSAQLRFDAPLECARCLEPFVDEVQLDFDEEYVLGAPHPLTGGLPEQQDGDFLIDDHWHLDLSEAVRQYEQSALPLMALCRPECPGFAATVPVAPSEPTTADRRWSVLGGLAAQLHEEETDGAPEA